MGETGSRIIALELTFDQLKSLSNVLWEVEDEGPIGEGWASDKVNELKKIVDDRIKEEETVEIKQFQVVEAVFNPQRKDDLVEGAGAMVGKKYRWQACFRIDTGPYGGQWAFMVLDTIPGGPPFAWAPESDLKKEET